MKQRKEAVQLHQQGQLSAAKKLYEQYLAEHPDDADSCHAFSVLLAQLKEHKNALLWAEKAVTLKQNQSTFYNSLGNIHARLEDYDQAIKAYKTAIKKDPQYASAYNNLARIYSKMQRWVAAEKAYLKAIELKPHFIDALVNLSILFLENDQPDKAIIYLNQVLAQDPSNLSASRQLAHLYLSTNEAQTAVTLLEKVAQHPQSQLDDLHALALAYFQIKNFVAAIDLFEQVLSRDTQYPEINHQLANALLQVGDYEKALTYYLRQISCGALPETYYNLGVLLLAKDRLKDALAYLEMAEKLMPNDFATQVNLGSLYLKQQDLSQAIVHYQKATALEPADEEIQHILAALTQNELPKKAPAAYLQHLFDHYAVYYDKHLTDALFYKAPDMIVQLLQREIDIDNPQWKILDLGCGTGLAGEKIKPFAKTLIGVDISENMLAIAKQKMCYDTLVQADIEPFLVSQFDCDLILAADVLTYLGDLTTVFSAVFSALSASGYFVFTVEKTYEPDFILQPSIRYAHNKSYIVQSLEKAGLNILAFDTIVLRQQRQQSIEGYLVLAKKSAISTIK